MRMENNSNQNNSSPASGNEDNNISGKDNLRGAASKTGVSGKSMIEENNAENTQGSGITGGSVIGGVNPEAGDEAGVGTSGGNEGTNGDLSGGAGGGTGISVQDDDNTRMGTRGAGDNS